jgi:hypothetical protein
MYVFIYMWDAQLGEIAAERRKRGWKQSIGDVSSEEPFLPL